MNPRGLEATIQIAESYQATRYKLQHRKDMKGLEDYLLQAVLQRLQYCKLQLGLNSLVAPEGAGGSQRKVHLA